MQDTLGDCTKVHSIASNVMCTHTLQSVYINGGTATAARQEDSRFYRAHV